MSPILAIDGPAGVGKTTITAKAAAILGIACLDTGAMFRLIALHLGSKALDMPSEELERILAGFSFSLAGTGPETTLFCNGEPAGGEIRTEAISSLASSLATRPEIRSRLLNEQRRLGRIFPLAADGRDMGTVVFPDAAFKFFLDATPEIRAQRRWLDLQARGQKIDLKDLAEKIRQRDHQDRTRPIAPLKPAADAIFIDTSDKDILQVLDIILGYIDAHGGRRVFSGSAQS